MTLTLPSTPEATHAGLCTVLDCHKPRYRRESLCTRHAGRRHRYGSTVCLVCRLDYDGHGRQGMCKPCWKTADSLGYTTTYPATDEPWWRDTDDDLVACPQHCGRPRHQLAAVAAPAIGLPACPGGTKAAC